MSVATLKKKTQALYQTQNNLSLSKKEVSYCSESCKNIHDKPAYLNIDQTFTGTNVFSVLPKSSAVPSSNTDLVNKSYVDSSVGSYYNLSLTGNTDVSGNTFYKNSTIRITSNGAYTVTIPLASASVLANTSQIYQNDSSFNITLISSANFQGKYGSNTTSLVLPANTWVNVVSNGTNWRVDDRSDNFNNAEVLSITGTTDLTTRLDLTNAFVYLNPTANNYQVNLAVPSSAQIGKIYTISNNSNSFYINLSISSGAFRGAYGSNSNSLLLPLNSWISFYSDGTNWVCNKVSDYGWTAPLIYANRTFQTITYSQWFREYVASNAGTNLVWNFTTPPSVSQIGLITKYKLIQPNSGAANRFGTAGSVSTGLSFIAYVNNITTNFLASVGATLTVEVLQSGAIGTNTGLTCTGTAGTNTLSVVGILATIDGTTTLTSGVLGFNSRITISGDATVYTVVGLRRAGGATPFGTCTGTAGSTTLTINTVTGFVQAGDTITIGTNTYLVETGHANSAGINITLSTVLLTSPAGTSWSVTLTSFGWNDGTVAVFPVLASSPSSTAFTITSNGAIYNVISSV